MHVIRESSLSCKGTNNDGDNFVETRNIIVVRKENVVKQVFR